MIYLYTYFKIQILITALFLYVLTLCIYFFQVTANQLASGYYGIARSTTLPAVVTVHIVAWVGQKWV
jgi:hypothetical protein